MPRDYESIPVDWTHTGDAYFPYEAPVGEQRWTLRMNEWPDYHSIYTLFVDGESVYEFDEWSRAWTRPT